MNTKFYVNKFREIANLDKLDQEALLERARYEAFAVKGLSGKYTLHLIASLVMSFVIAMTLSYLADFAPLASALSVGIGLFLASFYFRYQYIRLLRQGLLVVLAADKLKEG